MQQIVLIIHMLACFAIVGLVLLQQGKGSDIGAAFGSGASNTLFGSQGSTSFLLKITALVAFIFFATSLTLTHFSALDARKARALNLPVEQEWLPHMPTQTTGTDETAGNSKAAISPNVTEKDTDKD